MHLSKLTVLILLSVISNLIFIGCDNKKSDLPDTNKKENNITQQTGTQTQQVNTQNQTQKKDTLDTKIDSNKTGNAESSNNVVIETSMGNIEIELYEKDAPKHVDNFKKLVSNKFYESTTFHRVIPNFMIQGGDPNSKDTDRSNDGVGGPGYTIPAEIKAKHEKGSLAAARMGDQVNPKRESSGSQFYIVTGEASHLDGQYTVFGKVTKGLDIALKIQNVKRDERDNPIDKVIIKKVSFAK